MKGIFLLLGTNLGDRPGHLRQAIDTLSTFDLHIVDYSSIYESAPWGIEDQPWFLNMVLRVDTVLGPNKLLEACLESEARMGRKRVRKWGERIIDIDILYYENLEITTGELTVPHPAIRERRFTLMPLVEIAPDEIHPVLKQSHHELLYACQDKLECRKTNYELAI